MKKLENSVEHEKETTKYAQQQLEDFINQDPEYQRLTKAIKDLEQQL